MNSFMDLAITGSSVTGLYISASSSGGAPVQGVINGVTIGDLIAFTVLWLPSGSITSWTGQLVEEGGVQTIRTLWHLVTNIPDDNEDDKFWMSTWAGADEFVR